MISYAQTGEDVVLDRVLPLDRGFYVDIGASSPDASSVTRHFYEKGWSGINIEPRRDAWEELKRRRPRDLNLPIAVGAEDGMTTLYSVVEDPDLSTIDPDDLAFLTSKGYTYESLDVEVRSLDSILAVAGVSHIDFLKIDAEGAEEDILRGLDLTRWRPRVIVVEAIRPWSRDRTDHEWRGILELEIAAVRKDLEVKITYAEALEQTAEERKAYVSWLQVHYDFERHRADQATAELQAERSRLYYRMAQPFIRRLRGRNRAA